VRGWLGGTPPSIPPTRYSFRMAARITIASARFEDLVAIGLESLISEDPNLELVASGVDLEQLEGVLEKHRPSVVLINFGSLPNPAMLYQIHQWQEDTRIVVLANRPTAAECNQMLSFGATACISKETQGRDIINAIHLASRGMHVLPRSANATAGAEVDQFDLPAPDLLTAREADVLERLQSGLTNAQIAHELSIGVETVRTHARNIYQKLGISTRRDLARLGRPGRASPRVLEPAGPGPRAG
jgi:DNA-binding NarL/FixJ family response regulator